jgi:hypothetical protein
MIGHEQNHRQQQKMNSDELAVVEEGLKLTAVVALACY